MSIERHSATEIRNAGLHYTSTPREIAEALGRIGGAEAVGLWVLLVGNAKDYTVIKKVISDKYGMSERAFTRAMRSMEKLELAWIEVSNRKENGTFGGKSWCVSNLPRSVQDQLDSAVNKAKAMAEDAIKNNEMQPTPSKLQGRSNDQKKDSPTPAELPTSAENRPSVNCGDISNEESIKQSKNSLKKKKKEKTASSSKKSAAQSRSKYTPMTEDWRPSIETMNELAGIGITSSFVADNFAEFQSFWIDSGRTKMNWNEVLKADMERKMTYMQKQQARNQSQSTKDRTVTEQISDRSWAGPVVKSQTTVVVAA